MFNERKLEQASSNPEQNRESLSVVEKERISGHAREGMTNDLYLTEGELARLRHNPIGAQEMSELRVLEMRKKWLEEGLKALREREEELGIR